MTWSRSSLFNALESAGLSYALRQTARGEPYAGFRWHSAGVSPLGFTAIELDGAARLTVHGAFPVADAAGRMALTRRLALGRLVPSEDGPGSDLVVAFRSAPGLDGERLLALLAYMEQACAGAVGLPPRLDDVPLDPAAVLAELGFPVSGDGSALLPVGSQELLFHVHAVEGWWLLVAALSGTGAPWQLMDRLQTWAPVGRFLAGAGAGLSFESATPLLGRSPREALEAGLTDVEGCGATALRHLTASSEG